MDQIVSGARDGQCETESPRGLGWAVPRPSTTGEEEGAPIHSRSDGRDMDVVQGSFLVVCEPGRSRRQEATSSSQVTPRTGGRRTSPGAGGGPAYHREWNAGTRNRPSIVTAPLGDRHLPKGPNPTSPGTPSLSVVLSHEALGRVPVRGRVEVEEGARLYGWGLQGLKGRLDTSSPPFGPLSEYQVVLFFYGGRWCPPGTDRRSRATDDGAIEGWDVVRDARWNRVLSSGFPDPG